MVDERDSCCRSLRSRSTHSTSIDRRSHLFSHPICQARHLQRHVRVDLLMVYRPSLISELIHLSVLHVVLLVDSRLLRGVSPSLGHLSDIRPLFSSVVTWLLELSMFDLNFGFYAKCPP